MIADALRAPRAAGAPLLEQDRPLLEAFRRGEEEALSLVYFQYVHEVEALLRHGFFVEGKGLRCPGALDPELQRELIQETFLRAFAAPARQSYDGIRPYRAFLLRIARNLLVDRWRKKEPHALAEADGEAALEAEAPVASEEVLHWRTLSAATAEHLASLDAEERELVRLRFEEELGQREVAAAMGVSRRRVRTLEARVQDGLRRFLERRGLLGG